MVVPVLAQGFFEGFSTIPYLDTVATYLPWVAIAAVLKRYMGGSVNQSERVMHSKVIMITGGTSGIGAEVTRELAKRGAQIVLLTQHPLSDPFMVDYIMDMREQTGNQLITAEHVNLASLHSIRQFATKWVDNAPPRRLDMIILCGNSWTPETKKKTYSQDGLEIDMAVNYLANFHLLSILSPALRAQPADRDVRVIFGTCASYLGGALPDFAGSISPELTIDHSIQPKDEKSKEYASGYGAQPYQTSKLSLMTFATALQKRLDAYARPDKLPMNTKVLMVDPGWSRTPGMRRYFANGSFIMLWIYLLIWPLVWLLLKSPQQGAQTFLYAAMEATLKDGKGAKLYKECRHVKISRLEIEDEGIQDALWTNSEKTIEALEKAGAQRRALQKQADESKPAEKSSSTQLPTAEKQPSSARRRKA